MSSAEAELYAATRALSDTKGLKSIGDVQDALGRHEFELHKIGREYNPAGISTKPVPHEVMRRHLVSLGCRAVPSARRHQSVRLCVWTWVQLHRPILPLSHHSCCIALVFVFASVD